MTRLANETASQREARQDVGISKIFNAAMVIAGIWIAVWCYYALHTGASYTAR